MKMETIKDRLLNLLGVEPFVLITLLALIAYAIYRLLLMRVAESRHITLRRLFRELLVVYVPFVIFWSAQWLMVNRMGPELLPYYVYLAFPAVIFGAIVMIRCVRIFVFEYLFLKSMTAGVPVLLVNLVTLGFSIFVVAWLSTTVFGVRWAPLLATSAIVSVVLGLALQDTLGNLFAGVALQFDKPYEIGDWIEVHGTHGQVFVGEVHEITWRATILFGFFDEVLTLPNRLVAQSEVANFSARKKPIYRGLNIYLDPDANEERVKAILFKVLKETKGVLQNLEHWVMLRELNEKGAFFRLFYPIVHYNQQYFIVDEILMRAQAAFKAEGISISRLRVEVEPSASDGKGYSKRAT